MLNSCARDLNTQTGRFLRIKLTTMCFLPTGANKDRRSGKIHGAFFQGCKGLCAAECWLERRLHQLKVSTAMDVGITIFLIFA